MSKRRGKRTMNKAELVEALKGVGLREGMEIEVHSSLSSFGHVDGGAETVVEAIMECVGENGSIFMPALRLGLPMELTEEDRGMGMTVKIRILPEDAQRTGMGVIADTFRQRADVVTGKGVIRTSGWGRHAQQAAIGGFRHALHHGGKALLLGVDIYKLTAMHAVEYALPKEIRGIFAPTEEINRRYPPDEWFVEAGEPPVKPWYTIQEMARQRGLIREGHIGRCKYMFFDLWDVVGLYRKALETDPYGLYGLAGPQECRRTGSEEEGT